MMLTIKGILCISTWYDSRNFVSSLMVAEMSSVHSDHNQLLILFCIMMNSPVTRPLFHLSTIKSRKEGRV